MENVTRSLSVPAAAGQIRTRRGQERLRTTLLLIIILGGAIVIMIPLAWMVVTSLKRAGDVYLYPPVWLPNPPQWSGRFWPLLSQQHPCLWSDRGRQRPFGGNGRV